MKTMKPKFVLIGDIHFTVGTLELATVVLSQAINCAKELDIPLIINGDTLDSKAIMRGEVVNTLISYLRSAKLSGVKVYINVGNHDLINEKGSAHCLLFLTDLCFVVGHQTHLGNLNTWVIPYHHDKEELKKALKHIPKGNTVVIHQGVLGADLGHYVQDRTSLSPEDFSGLNIFASHYHKYQTISTPPRVEEGQNTVQGSFTYIGNPYTLTFGEANDPEKGFVIVNEDNSYTRVPTGVRKHIIIDTTIDELKTLKPNCRPGDLVWLKIRGPESSLNSINKKDIGQELFGHSNFKLDLIPDEAKGEEIVTDLFTDNEIFDRLIDSIKDSAEIKNNLKSLWRKLLNEDISSNC